MPPPPDATSVVDAQKRAAPELKAVADFLRGKNGPKVRRGVLNGKRVDFFKGKTAVRVLLGPQYQKLKKVPAVTNEQEAHELMTKVLPFGFFLRVDRPNVDPPPPSGVPKPLQLAQQQSFAPDVYYAWFYDGSPFWNIVGGIAMVAVMLAGVMFPLWPTKLRVGVWYLSVAALCMVGMFIVIAIIRLILWCITKVAMPKAIWIFPNLFEDVGFWDEPKKKKLRKVGEKRRKEKREKRAAAAANNAPVAPAGNDSPAPSASPAPGGSTATATGAEAPITHAHRRQATVEDVEDEN
ncbi:hypothetical protein A1Q2_00543 [Trichosporon asahii var. asahii CBS 8904]|uniref:Translocation protein SEC62 n=1 Tax=Trichosporon asahii var. asahii (strain CBS 8904) TaxID=1220162 RepID=K1W047_TRIAC|nr:hypothetical protein A1Q2_00543 [Trichosporon asahii var. asahii CBS 8904]